MDIIEVFKEFIFHESLTLVVFTLILLFSALYFGISMLFKLTISCLIKRDLASKIVLSKKFPNQLKHEILHSLYSVLIFALYGLLIIVLIRKGILDVHFKLDYFIFIDLVILIIWNEIHFYLCHRIMHTQLLIRLHAVHHKSKVVTPFSTYSFHPIESVLNGTVLIIPMFFYSF